MTDSSATKRAGAADAAPLNFDSAPEQATDPHIWWRLFEHYHVPTLVVDSRGKILHANLAVENYSDGLPRDQLLGRSFLDLIQSPERAALRKIWPRVQAGEKIRALTTQLRRRDGGTTYVDFACTPLAVDSFSDETAPKSKDSKTTSQQFVVTLQELSQQTALHHRGSHPAQHLTALNDLNETLSRTLVLPSFKDDWQAFLDAALDKSLEVLGAQMGLLALTDDLTQELTLCAQRGLESQKLILAPQTGLAGLAVHTQQVVVSHNLAQDPRAAQAESSWSEMDIRTVALAPMCARNGVLGVLGIGSPQLGDPKIYSLHGQQLLAAVANRVGLALDNAHLYAKIQRRQQEQSALHEVAVATRGELSLHTVMEQGLRAPTLLFELDAAAIHFVDRQNRLLPLATQGSAIEYWQKLRENPPRLEETLTGRYAQQKRTLVIPDLENFEEPMHPQAQASGMRTLVSVPLLIGGRLVGLLEVGARRPHALGSEDLPLLESLGGQLAAVIEAARLYEQSERRVKNLTTLTQISAALNKAQNLEETLQVVLDETMKLAGSPDKVGAIFLVRPAQGTHPAKEKELFLDLTAWRGLSEAAIAHYQQRPPTLRDSGLARVFQTAEIVPFAAQAPDCPEMLSQLTGSLIAVPLSVENSPIGIVLIGGQPVGEELKQLLSGLADVAAVAIEKAHFHQETQRRLDEMTLLFNFAQHLSTNLQMDLLLDTIVTAIRKVLGCRGVSIALLDPETQMLEIKAAAGLKQKWRQQARLRVGEGIMGQAAATQEPVYVPDVHAVKDFIFFDQSFHSLLSVPLVTKNQVLGTLSIDHQRPDAFSEDDERLVTIAAAQAAVAIQNAKLFQDLQERATSLTQAYKELKEIDQMKDELVQNVSHELRTPLTFVRGYIDLLLGGDMGPLNERQLQSLQIVSQKTATVTELVNNIMLLQQLEHKTLQLALTDVVSIAGDALTRSQAEASQQAISLHLEAPSELPLVLADPDRLTMVFDNLLNNAIKFSPNGGEVWVRLQEQAQCIQISISDQGIGISQDQLERIFERFYQADGSATRRFEGAGLGLTIAKRIIQAHDGEIWAHSQVDKGSTFYFTLPKSR